MIDQPAHMTSGEEIKASSRQRMLDAFEFNDPDKIPVVYHPSTAGLYVHGKKLLDLLNQYPPDNPILFDHLPRPPEHAFDDEGQYHELIKDEWGTLWEYRIFGIQGHPKEYPFSSWKEGLEYSLPAIPQPGTDAYEKEKTEVQKDMEQFLIFKGWISIFEKLHALRPMDEMLMDLATRENDIIPFIERLTDYWTEVIHYYLEIGADVIVFGDDWGSQTGQFVSTNPDYS